MDYAKIANYARVVILSGIAAAGPYAADGCERWFAYREPLCPNLNDAAQNLPVWFGTSTATNAL